MIKIVSFNICPFVQRVVALLEAKDIPYEVEFISLKDKPQWFLDVSPSGQVPVLITENNIPLFESDAIVEYIEEAFPPLQPELTPEEKALNRAWSYLATKHYLTQCSAQRNPSEEVLQKRAATLGKAFDKIEERLTGETKFFSGDTINLVDIAWLVLLHRADIIQRHSGYDFIGARPKLKEWQQSLMASGLSSRSVATDFEGAFAKFYLSEKTFLGKGLEVQSSSFHQDGDTTLSSLRPGSC